MFRRASSGKSTETIRQHDPAASPAGCVGASLESRLHYFFRQQAAAEGLIPAALDPDASLDSQTAGGNLGVGQILPSLLSAAGEDLESSGGLVHTGCVMIATRVPRTA